MNMIEQPSARHTVSTLCSLLMLGLTTATPASAGVMDWATGPSIYDEEGKRDWGVEIIPYLWIASLTGEVGIPPVGTIPVSATFSDLSDHLDAAFAGFMDVRYRRWHVVVDGSWVSLKTSVVPSPAPLQLAEFEGSVAFGTAGASYELPLDWGASIELYLAARWWHVTADALILTAGPLVAGGTTKVWTDAIVGTRVRYAITEKWRVAFTADIGAGNSNLDWQVLGSVGYMFNPYFGLTAGYRILGVDYESNFFKYDVRQSGLLLGFNFAY
jgi:hypothetical protein